MAKRYTVGILTGSIHSNDLDAVTVSGVSLTVAKKLSQVAYDYARSQIGHKTGKALTWKRGKNDEGRPIWQGCVGDVVEVEFGN